MIKHVSFTLFLIGVGFKVFDNLLGFVFRFKICNFCHVLRHVSAKKLNACACFVLFCV